MTQLIGQVLVIYIAIASAHPAPDELIIAGLNERLKYFEDCNIRIQDVNYTLWNPLTVTARRCGHFCEKNEIFLPWSKWHTPIIKATRGSNFKFRKICELDIVVHLSSASYRPLDAPILAYGSHIEDGFNGVTPKSHTFSGRTGTELDVQMAYQRP